MEIKIIEDVTPTDYIGSQAIYRFHAPYQWLRTTTTVRATPEEANADAVAWLREYEASDRYGNMGCVLGVTPRDGGFVGVINYYHSNS